MGKHRRVLYSLIIHGAMARHLCDPAAAYSVTRYVKHESASCNAVQDDFHFQPPQDIAVSGAQYARKTLISDSVPCLEMRVARQVLYIRPLQTRSSVHIYHQC
jgi:hypothetical protein